MKRILIVDDDTEIIGSLAMLLAEKYEVVVASDGFTALRKLKAGAYDLIVLDLLMPGVDGAGFVRELNERNNATPVILISASINVAKHARGLNVADYLGKPFHIDDLEARIDRIVGVEHARGTGASA